MINNRNKITVNNFLLINFLSLPFFIVSGPFLANLSVLISSLIFFFLIIKKKFYQNYFNNYFVIFFLIWCLYLILNSLISDNFYHSLSSTLFYFRFIFFALSIYLLFIYYNNFLLYLFISLSVLFSILVIDSFIQIFVGFNLIGYKYFPGRASSFFGDELILGSFFSRIFPIYIGTYYLIKNNVKNLRILNIIFLFNFISVSIAIFYTGERIAFFYLILTFVLFFLISNFSNYKKLILLLIIITTIIFSSTIYKDSYNRLFLKTYNQFIMLETETRNTYVSQYLNFHPFSIEHERHLASSFLMIKDNLITGIGANNFRIKCNEDKYYIGGGCSTHPHNTHIQLLLEVGLIGYLPFLLFYIYVIYLFFLQFFNKSISDINKNIASHFFYFSFIINLFPLIPSGNFFNNWLSIYFYFSLGFIFIINSRLIGR